MSEKQDDEFLSEDTLQKIIAAEVAAVAVAGGYLGHRLSSERNERNNVGYQTPKRPATNATAYSRQDIERYIQAHVKFVEGDEAIKARAEHIYKIYADNIQKLPPWQQVLIVEGNQPITFGKDSYVVQRDAAGIFAYKKGVYARHYGTENNSTDVYYDKDFIGTISHEKGHEFDWHVIPKKPQFWSDTNDKWKNAISMEMADRSDDHVSRILKEAPHQRALGNHLKNEDYYKLTDRPREALAQITNIANEVYANRKGNWQETNRFMQQNYPHAWPVYRDEFIPLMQKNAQRLNPHVDVSIPVNNPPKQNLMVDNERTNIIPASDANRQRSADLIKSSEHNWEYCEKGEKYYTRISVYADEAKSCRQHLVDAGIHPNDIIPKLDRKNPGRTLIEVHGEGTFHVQQIFKDGKPVVVQRQQEQQQQRQMPAEEQRPVAQKQAEQVEAQRIAQQKAAVEEAGQRGNPSDPEELNKSERIKRRQAGCQS